MIAALSRFVRSLFASGDRRLRGRAASRRAKKPRRERRLESLERRELLAGLPLGAMPNDTGEYMLGKIAVSVVFLESDSMRAPRDPNTEDWTAASISAMKSKIETGLNWWQQTLANVAPKHADDLQFVMDYTYADSPLPTGYEAINRQSNDFSNWIKDFFEKVQFNQSSDFNENIRAYNNSRRLALGTDWAFTIFVVNSENDFDDAFASGGTFSRAFAFAGGRFLIVPSGRPASTISHETGHMFWALDEYTGANYSERRGYYDTANLNAPNNPAPGFTQQPSIMATGSLLNSAYANFTSSASTLAMIGWQDSDDDGVFDVLDVPHTLTGTGYLDAATGKYRFQGSSAVQTLPNRNSTGLQSDITLNKISRAEWRLDGGAWTTAATYGGTSAMLDLTLTVPTGSHTIEIRTIDDATGVTSAIFSGNTTQPTSIGPQGISGFVFNDIDGNGQRDTGDYGLSGWTVQLVDAGGSPLNLTKSVEPDNFTPGQSIAILTPGITVTATGSDVDSDVSVGTNAAATTGSRVFQNRDPFLAPAPWNSTWSATKKLKFEFTNPTTSVSIDVIANSSNDYGRLEIYDAGNNLLDRVTTRTLQQGETERLRIASPTANIAYAIATGYLDSDVLLDNFVAGPASSATTDLLGAYSIPYIPAGTYFVKAKVPASWTPTGSPAADQQVTLVNGQSRTLLNFAERGSTAPWRNPLNALDVDNDSIVAPVDVLLIINDLNINGSRQLPAPNGIPAAYLDVTGDGFIAPDDALLVINHLNSLSGGEGRTSAPAGNSSTSATTSSHGESPASEGETPPELPPHIVVLKSGSPVAGRNATVANVAATSTPAVLFAATDLRSRVSSRRWSPLASVSPSALDATLATLAPDIATAWHMHDEMDDEMDDEHHHHHDD